MVPKSTQDRSKINQKSISDASLFSTLFFNRFLIIFRFPEQAPEPQKSLKTNWFFNIFILSAVSNSCYVYIKISIKFGSILDQKSAKSPLNFRTADPKSRRSRFRVHFGRFLGPKIDVFLIGTHRALNESL